MALAIQGNPELVTAGRARTVYWGSSERLATSLARRADAARNWPGIAGDFSDSVTIILAPNRPIFDSVTSGRLPEWGAAGAFPEAMTIVLRVDEDPGGVLSHELAHLALHSRVRHPPVWFSEGYAVWAAGEWGRLDRLRVNFALVRGRVPTLSELSRQLREGRANAASAYALAATAIVTLDRMGGEDGMERLISEFSSTGNLDAALRQAYLITIEGFEETWQQEIRRRYGWLSLFTSFTVFWAFFGGALVVVWVRRRRRDRERRDGLDEGWFIPENERPPEVD